MTRRVTLRGTRAQVEPSLRGQLLGNAAVLHALVDLLGSQQPPAVRAAAAGALGVLATHKDAAEKIAAAGGADALLFVTLDGAAGERAAAGVALARLAALNGDVRELFVEHGGVSMSGPRPCAPRPLAFPEELSVMRYGRQTPRAPPPLATRARVTRVRRRSLLGIAVRGALGDAGGKAGAGVDR